jgi:hypothetical protein
VQPIKTQRAVEEDLIAHNGKKCVSGGVEPPLSRLIAGNKEQVGPFFEAGRKKSSASEDFSTG